jgi:hypothetical protein
MRHSAVFLAPVIVLIAGLSVARGETVEADAPWNPWWLRVITQAPVTMPLSKASAVPQSDPVAYPPSGVLLTLPPAPVAVPTSGVLQPPPERQTITTIPLKITPLRRGAETAAAVTTPTRHLRPTVVRSPESQKREHLARSVASARATTAREMRKTRIFAVAGQRQVPVLHSRW